ncbi:hypothetical protein SDJN03_15189, partial [Cucurbita argyrosperma subsp. sororia]
MELPFLQRISMIKALPIFPNETTNGGLSFSEAQLPLPLNQRGENSINALPLRDLDELANKIALRRLPKTRLATRYRHSQDERNGTELGQLKKERNYSFCLLNFNKVDTKWIVASWPLILSRIYVVYKGFCKIVQPLRVKITVQCSP